jgi:hypothetical protein
MNIVIVKTFLKLKIIHLRINFHYFIKFNEQAGQITLNQNNFTVLNIISFLLLIIHQFNNFT